MQEVKDNRRRARFASAALGACCIMQISTIALVVAFAWGFGRGDPGTLRLLSKIGVGMVVATGVAVLAAAVTFLAWFHRAYGNALATGSRSQWSRGWAIGAWFVPVLNCFLPAQLAAEILDHAESLTGRGSRRALVMVWWLCWVGGNIINWFGTLMLGGQPVRMPPGGRLELLSENVVLNVVVGMLEIVSLLCAIALVRRVTALQPEAALRWAARVFDEASSSAPDAPAAMQEVGMQVVGMNCAECGKRVGTVMDAVACRSCRHAFHRRCAVTAICNRCGGDDLVRGVAAI
jgi:hypothetical protein